MCSLKRLVRLLAREELASAQMRGESVSGNVAKSAPPRLRLVRECGKPLRHFPGRPR